jgi:hypothetical protein
MDPWKELAAREECRDAVRAWAELEGNNPQTADDLPRRFCDAPLRKSNWRLAVGVGIRLTAWAYDVWWYVTRR